MKNVKLFAQLLIIVSASLFASCSPENLNDVSSPKQILSKGQWSVDYYFSGQDKTSLYNDFHFSFIGNGTVTAINGTNTIKGTWSMITDVSRNQVLKINIDSQEPFLLELNDQWSVTNSSTDAISMKDASGELRLRKL
jgi:hypothetical protein